LLKIKQKKAHKHNLSKKNYKLKYSCGMSDRGQPKDRLNLPKNAASHIDAYFEYNKIVGNDDGGVPFTPEEYEKYKREVLPMVNIL